MTAWEVLQWTPRRLGGKNMCLYCLVICLFVIVLSHLTISRRRSLEIIVAANHGTKASITVAKHSRWIVVTTINHPTKALIALSRMIDWKMVVVGDRKSPKEWAIPGVVFLDVAAQHALGYKTTPLLPYDRYTRKTIGYLYAIEHGARYIYETDDDNILLDELRGFGIDAAVSHGLMPATENMTFNPYPHFGQGSLWPRGYPLEEVGHDTTYDYRLCSVSQASIRQAVANGDPDVDAVFRLTRRHHSDDGKLMFDAIAPRIVIPRDTFVPFNSQDTLFAVDALWALVLPATLSDRACDIYRSYWAQALLWLVDGHLGFYPPNVMHVRNVHSFLKDLSQETDMYQDMGRLVKFLHKWKCDQQSLFGCMTKLAVDMAVNKFWLKRDAEVIFAWVADLTNIGYIPPAIRQSSTCSDGVTVKFFPYEHNTSFAHIASMSYVRADQIHHDARLYLMQRVCNVNVYTNVATETLLSKPKLLLVVTMHSPTTTIPLIDMYYKRCYTHILYCGASAPDVLLRKWKISYLTVANTTSAISCMTGASEMGYNVEGFMHVSDKMLLLSGNKSYTHGTSHIWVAENTPDMAKLCKENKANCLVLTEGAINYLIPKLDTLETEREIKRKLKECLKKFLPTGASVAYFVEEVAFYVPECHMKLFRALADLYIGQYSYVSVLLLGCIETESLYLNSTRKLTHDHPADFIFPFLFSAVDTDTSLKNQYCKSMQSC